MSEPKITDSKNIFITYNVVKRVINKYVKEDLIPVLDTIKNRKRSIANYEQAIIQLNNKLKSYRKWSFFTKRKRGFWHVLRYLNILFNIFRKYFFCID